MDTTYPNMSTMGEPIPHFVAFRKKAHDTSLNFGKDFILGGVSAAIFKTFVAPVERVRLIMSGPPNFRTYPWIFRRVIRDQGAFSLWRGNGANLIRSFPPIALNFAFRGHFQARFGVKKEDEYFRWFGRNMLIGGIAGGSSLLLVYNLDYARTRLALDRKGQYKNLMDVYRQALRSDGISGLYRGFTVSCVGVVLYRGCYFGLYDTLKPLFLHGKMNDSFWASFILAWGVTNVAGFASYPIDTIRRRMMMTKYPSSISCATEILRKEGLQRFFKGYGGNMFRAIFGAGVLAGFDQLKLWFA